MDKLLIFQFLSIVGINQRSMIKFLTLDDWVYLSHNVVTGISTNFFPGKKNLQDRCYQQACIYLQH